MSRPRHVAVIDIGKSNAKVALVDLAELREIEVRTTPNDVVFGRPFPHHDTAALWVFIKDALGRMQRTHGVDAISATTHGAAVMLLDSDGEPILPLLDYEYEGPAALADEYDTLRPDFASSGSPRLPFGLNLGAQLHWLVRTRPELQSRLETVVTYPQYWTGRLTGTWSTEVTLLGCHSDLWLPRERRLSALVENLGLGDKMAPVRSAGDMIGTLLPDVARETGLAQSTPVHCGIHDSNASLYPHLLGLEKPFSVLSTGTWVIVMAIGGTAPPLDPELDTLMNVNAFGEPVPSARFMGGREFEMVTDGTLATPTADDVTAVLRDGITLSPAVVAHSGPFRGRSAEWSVPLTALDAGRRTAAGSFYLSMMAMTCLELIGAEGAIVTEGPFAANRWFLDLLAAASGRQVLVTKGSATGTSIGAALLATDDPPAATAYEPHPAPAQAYRDDLCSYAELWRRRARS